MSAPSVDATPNAIASMMAFRFGTTVKRIVSVGSGSGVYEADQYDIRKIETRVMIPSGNTLVLGGLVCDYEWQRDGL